VRYEWLRRFRGGGDAGKRNREREEHFQEDGSVGARSPPHEVLWGGGVPAFETIK